jgi:hypothetical protein
LWLPSKWPEFEHIDDFSMLLSVMGMRKKWQGDKSGDYSLYSRRSFDVLARNL